MKINKQTTVYTKSNHFILILEQVPGRASLVLENLEI